LSGQRKALIVANDEYEQEALRDLLAPAADAEALGRVLGDQQIGDFTVQVVRNEPAHVISAQIEELFSESRPDDVLLLHFSGHGLKSESGELFFAASNTRPNRLGSTAVSADFVQRCMRASRSRSVVLLLDCCYGGAFAQGVKVRAAGDVNVLDSFPQERTGGGRGRAVITASSAMEYAFEGDRLSDDQHRRPSVFTGALAEGLATGDADRDEDGWVSLNELYDYVFDKVREQNPHQTPSRQVELEGELYVARSRRRRIRPVPLPPDLQAAVTDPNMFTRLGAVSELTARLTSDNLPTAAGAYEALADLARTDIRSVADLAGAALSQAALHPEETELHFGRIEQGSAPPHRTVRMLGPPIARACAPRALRDWIRVNETDEGLDISVDTANAGILRGNVDLKGPTGEAIIAIDVEFLPTPSAAQASQEAGQRQAEEQARREAGQRQAEEQARREAGQRQAEEQARREAGQRQTTPPVAPVESQPPIRRGIAYAGSVIALLAGVAALISVILYDVPGTRGAAAFFNITGTVVFIAAATAALLQINRLVIIGFLQGALWLAVTYLAYDIVQATHLHGYTGRLLAGYLVEVPSDVLGVIAAVLLMMSWSPAAERRRAPRLGALPVMLLCGVGLSQIAELIFELNAFRYFTNSSAINAEHITAILVGLAVTWYALSLRARPPGGALILGWATVTVIFLLADITGGWPVATGATRTWGVLGCVLLAIVVTLTVVYMRRQSDPEPSHPEKSRGSSP
jgi:Caspase domain